MSKSAVKVRGKRAGRVATGMVTTALTLGGLGLASGIAGAADAPPTGPGGLAPVPHSANSPPARPAGCPDGAAALVGLQFDNGRGMAVSDLRQLAVHTGDVVTM